MTERKYFAISIKHTEYRWKFGMPCVLWGQRTQDHEKRSFAGYTRMPQEAEIYSLQDWADSGYTVPWMKIDAPVRMSMDLCKRWKKYDTVLVLADDYIKYCEVCGLPLNREGHHDR